MKIRKQNAITLISLIITIIVLLILAGVVISLVLDNGIIRTSQQAERNTYNARIEENIILESFENFIHQATWQEKEMPALSIYVDGNLVNEMPTKDSGYKFNEIIATDEANVSFDVENWVIIKDETKPNAKIVISFINMLDDWKTLAKIAKLNPSDYADLNSMLNNEQAIDQILNTKEAINYLVLSSDVIFPEAIKNIAVAEKIFNNKSAMQVICEDANARLILYNNAATVEELLQNSEVAISTMKESSQCELTSCYGQARTNNTKKIIYNGKAFVFSTSQNYKIKSGEKGGIIYNGNYIVGSSTFIGASSTTSYGADGKNIIANKFASTVVAYRSECSNRNFYYYALIFKI